MSNSPPPVTPTDHAMNEWSKEGKVALGSESKGGVTPTFDTLMEELAGKIQGKTQTVKQFAAQVEAAVINIHQSHPAQMSESCMMQVERTQFFHVLRRTYKETFRHLYEEEGASFERILWAASTMEEAMGSLTKIPKSKESEKPQLPTRRRSRVNSPPKKTDSWGWTRTRLEPEVVVYVNNQPMDAILDLGSSVSLIDREITDDMNVKLTPYIHDVPQCVSVEGLKFTNSVINIVGWVEIELGVLGIGCLTTRLWVTNSLFNKGVPIVLGSHQIKQILAQANLKRMDCWQQPWRYIYEGCAEGKWYSDRCDEELSDSDSSFEVLPKDRCQCPDRMIERLRVSTPTWEEQIRKAEELIERSGSTALKGIPGPLKEPNGQEDSIPAAQVVHPLPRVVEMCPGKDGDESSVFANLTKELDGPAAEAQTSPCNSKVIAQTNPSTVRLPPFPTVSCKITPTGDTIFSLQWDQK